MKKLSLIFYVSFSLVFYLNAQNLVPNGDFEDYNKLPSNAGQWEYCNSWSSVNGNIPFLFPYGSPDYFHTQGINNFKLPNTSLGYVDPYSGEAIMGLATINFTINYREYLSTKLDIPMCPWRKYKVSFWLTNGFGNISSGLSSDHFGVVFSSDSLTQIDHEPINRTPQIEIVGEIWETEWKQYSFIYVPDSSFNYLTIGNFYTDDQTSTTNQLGVGTETTAYYFIDKIVIEPVNPNIQAKGDSVICIGDTASLLATNYGPHSWAEVSNPSVILSDSSVLVASPIITTTYLIYGSKDTVTYTLYVNLPELNLGEDLVICSGDTDTINASHLDSEYLWQDGSSNSSIEVSEQGAYWLELSNDCGLNSDTIKVSEMDCACYLKVPNAFTPNGDNVNDVFSAILDCEYSQSNMNIYTRWGEKVYSGSSASNGWNGKYKNQNLPVDVYFYVINFLDRKGVPEVRSGSVSLIR